MKFTDGRTDRRTEWDKKHSDKVVGIYYLTIKHLNRILFLLVTNKNPQNKFLSQSNFFSVSTTLRDSLIYCHVVIMI